MTSNYTTRTYRIDYSAITPGNNDRTIFNLAELQALADNIRANGLLQPIMVRPITEGQYQIILGERRYRAIGLLGWEKVACIVRNVTDEEASAGMLSENMARANLDPIDEALAYQSRMDRFGWSVEELARIGGVSTTRVLFRLKLLRLRDDLQALVRTENIPLGYAQILADAELNANMQALAIDRLRDNATPTPAWFRRECGKLLTSQAQAETFNVFDNPELYAQPSGDGTQLTSWLSPSPMPEPAEQLAMPGLTMAPTVSGTPQAIMQAQIAFWRNAAHAWDNKGKNFKRQECRAAAHALETALAMF